MKIVKADILSNIDPNRLTIILHGCNCWHVMGAGIAGYLAKKFPVVLQVDKTTAYRSVEKLGTISIATIDPQLYVVNCYTQYQPGAHAKLNYIDMCLKYFVAFGGERLYTADIRLPKIGCGIGGLNWKNVEPVIAKHLSALPTTIYHL